MSEDDDLKRKIAQLSGQINRREQEGSTTVNRRGAYTAISPSKAHLEPAHVPRPAYQTSSRGAPSGRGRGGRGRATFASHKNRTLVLNNVVNHSGPDATAPDSNEATVANGSLPRDASSSSVGWVAKHDRHKQLINPAVYEREVKARARDMEASRRLKAQRRDEREKAKLARHLQRLSAYAYPSSHPASQIPPTPAQYEITIQGIRFRVTSGGSRLLKMTNESNASRPTPKRANVGGVTFIRSKNGNLYRSGVVKAQRRGAIKKINEPCPRFTTTASPPGWPRPDRWDLLTVDVCLGSCPKGPLCPYLHDPNKVAICKEFLQTGACPAGESCDLSHDPTPERVPACLHFIKGNCSNAQCRYAHVRVNPGAPVCRRFATLGFCESGAQCTDRHVHECPDYANTGTCHNKKCRLPHIDRAGQIRKSQVKAASAAAQDGDEAAAKDDGSDLSSDEEDAQMDSDDVDSDGLTDDFLEAHPGPGDPDVAAQQDFIHF
ncbi:MAG: hypothetical protein M1838_000471 [Thelocarpon superellum]|nr:MAG: hypothetical protein M1838_000471 [Thelocarpon superellum]